MWVKAEAYHHQNGAEQNGLNEIRYILFAD